MPETPIITGTEPHHLLAVFARYKSVYSLSALAKGCKSMLEAAPFIDILYRPDGTGLTDDPQVKERIGRQSIGRNMMRPAAEDEPSDRRYRRWRKDWLTASHDPRWYAACLFIACEHERYTGWRTGAADSHQRLIALWERYGQPLLKAIEEHQTANEFDAPTAGAPPPPVETGPDEAMQTWEARVRTRWDDWCAGSGGRPTPVSDDLQVLGRELLNMAILQQKRHAPHQVRRTANLISVSTPNTQRAERFIEGDPAKASADMLQSALRELRDFLSVSVFELELLGDKTLLTALPSGCSIELSTHLEILVRTALNDHTAASPNEKASSAFHNLTKPSPAPRRPRP
jgi:hypothetical protein